MCSSLRCTNASKMDFFYVDNKSLQKIMQTAYYSLLLFYGWKVAFYRSFLFCETAKCTYLIQLTINHNLTWSSRYFESILCDISVYNRDELAIFHFFFCNEKIVTYEPICRWEDRSWMSFFQDNYSYVGTGRDTVLYYCLNKSFFKHHPTQT